MDKRDFISVAIIFSVIVICFAMIFVGIPGDRDNRVEKEAKSSTGNVNQEADAPMGVDNGTTSLDEFASDVETIIVTGQNEKGSENSITGKSENQTTTNQSNTSDSGGKNTGGNTVNTAGNSTGNNNENSAINNGGNNTESSTENNTGSGTDNSTGNNAEEATTGNNTNETMNLLSRLNNVTVTPENLGVPAALTNKYGSNGLAKNIWDMKAYNGKVFIGTGDYEKNTGSTPIYYFTNNSTELKATTCTLASGAVQSALNTEAVERFFVMDGSLYALATDVSGQPAYCGYYKYDEVKNTWQEYNIVYNGIHLYDIVEYDGRIFIGGMAFKTGTNDIVGGCVMVLDKSDLGTGTKAEMLEFYQPDGVTPYPTTKGNKYYYWRVYDMFVYKGELYAIHHIGGANLASGLFKYDKEKNAFLMLYDGEAIRGVIAVANRRTTYTYIKDAVSGQWIETDCYYDFNTNELIQGRLKIGMEYLEGQSDDHGNLDEKFVVGNTIVLVKNGIYKADGIKDFQKVSLGSGCDNYVVRDAFEMDGKYYFLASEMLGKDNYTTTVFETDANFTTYRKILSMNTQSFARSFVYNDGYLYIGLGSNQSDSATGYSQYSGTILRVDLESI